jgi:hypothetical protein
MSTPSQMPIAARPKVEEMPRSSRVLRIASRFLSKTAALDSIQPVDIKCTNASEVGQPQTTGLKTYMHKRERLKRVALYA